MNLKVMRNIHLYLGVFFAPLLVFFLISGCWQTFRLQDQKKGSDYHPPEIIKSLSAVHEDQRWGKDEARSKTSMPFKCLIVMMSIGVLLTTVLGIVMAFKYTQPWIVWLCLLIGTVVPCGLLWIALNR